MLQAGADTVAPRRPADDASSRSSGQLLPTQVELTTLKLARVPQHRQSSMFQAFILCKVFQISRAKGLWWCASVGVSDARTGEMWHLPSKVKPSLASERLVMKLPSFGGRGFYLPCTSAHDLANAASCAPLRLLRSRMRSMLEEG